MLKYQTIKISRQERNNRTWIAARRGVIQSHSDSCPLQDAEENGSLFLFSDVEPEPRNNLCFLIFCLLMVNLICLRKSRILMKVAEKK